MSLLNKKMVFGLGILCLAFLLFSCSQEQSNVPPVANSFTLMPTPKIDRHPVTANYNRGRLSEIGTHNPTSGDPFEVDLRSYDLTQLDLRAATDQMQFASFDDKTRWPDAEYMPTGFDWRKIMELGKNPGLGVHGLHQQGITGTSVGIAIIDQPLQIEHPEYYDRLQLYEEINFHPNTSAQMHGPAVASLAVGKTSGTAPGADLYLIADWFVDPDQKVNFEFLAQGIRRILEINRTLPEGRKIRVISISRGFGPEERGYNKLMAAIQEADRNGIPVISVGMFGSKKVAILGLSRDLLADPDLAKSYRPAAFLEVNIDQIVTRPEQLWIPIDARTTASPTGIEDYVFYGMGGMSWAEPYLAGIYALACQVSPKITPEQFWSLARETGKTIDVERNGEKYLLGPIIDPVALIEKLK